MVLLSGENNSLPVTPVGNQYQHVGEPGKAIIVPVNISYLSGSSIQNTNWYI